MNRRQKKKQISRQRKLEEKAWEGLFNYLFESAMWRKNTRRIISMICNESKSGVHLHYGEIPENHIIIDFDLPDRKDKNEQATEEEIKETN